MCRIAGIIDPSKPMEILEHSVKRMCKILQHGGPDGEGLHISSENYLVFGHRRLALLDLSEAGHQPMSYDNGRYEITYNGEIYNYPQLKRELEKLGYSFKTVCDTEMILVAFAAWGINAFDKFNGMFAFALLDNKERKVYLVRDASGIKPLYYVNEGNKLYFASEERAFKIFPELNYEDPQAKVLLLAYGHLPEPVTTLKDVRMLQKGCCFTFELASGKNSLLNFSNYIYTEDIKDRQEAKNIIREQLSLSIKEHLLSDAPIGVFLSGGIDSSLIALLAHKHTGNNLNTLSLYFNEQNYSEKKYQDLIIGKANCRHAQFLLRGEDFSNNFERVLQDMDVPSTDGINTWFISKYAKESGLKAVLSGVGSDEIFGGYPSFRRMRMLKYFKKLPSFVLKTYQGSHINKLKRLAFLNIPGPKGEYLFLRGLMNPLDISKLLNIAEEDVWKILNQVPSVPGINKLSLGNQASWMEMNLYMQNQLLRDSDIMSMAHGIEIRVPFLGKNFVNEAMRISSNLKYSGILPKQLLIDAFKGLLPELIWNRPKMGFTFPFKDWMHNNEFVRTTMNAEPRFNAMYKRFEEGNLPWSHLMAVMVLQNKING